MAITVSSLHFATELVGLVPLVRLASRLSSPPLPPLILHLRSRDSTGLVSDLPTSGPLSSPTVSLCRYFRQRACLDEASYDICPCTARRRVLYAYESAFSCASVCPRAGCFAGKGRSTLAENRSNFPTRCERLPFYLFFSPPFKIWRENFQPARLLTRRRRRRSRRGCCRKKVNKKKTISERLTTPVASHYRLCGIQIDPRSQRLSSFVRCPRADRNSD